ncbi:hypothetical protein [Sinirhodobacter huangdaonensis]|uniref:Tail tape measure protein n=1 Tax=Paenirhodobacter huangdaonensis TaxID=2501515 RepID=A0A3S3LQX5_9RHOB|nr:hypothetical protein [Sinirhodobacter huangdaonensis]RWR54883.1 hypothetical protein EOW66_02115 [Sinirhodobacter huangdaonensis]
MAGILTKLMAKLGIDTAEFDKGLKKSETTVHGFGEVVKGGVADTMSRMTGLGTAFVTGLAGGAVTAAFAAITSNIRGTVRGIAEIGDEAKKSGLGLEAFQEWKYVAEQNRVGVDALVDGFKELSLRADEWIKTGGGAGEESFRRLGFTATDLAQRLKDPSALMLEIIKRLEHMDKAAQIRILDEVMGGTGGEQFVQLLDQGADGLRETIRLAHEAGAVFDAEMIAKATELDRRYAALGARVERIAKRAAVTLADIPVDIFENRITDFFRSDEEGIRSLGQGIYEYYKSIGALTDEQMRQVQDIRDGYLFLTNAAVDMSSELKSAASRASDMGNDDLAQTLSDAAQEMQRLALEYRQGAITGQEFAAGVAAARDRAADALSELQAVNAARFDGVIGSLSEIGRALGFDGGAADKAGMAQDELRALNEQKFGGVLSGLGDIGAMLDRLISGANTLRNAMPGSPAAAQERDDGRGYATGNADNAWTGTGLAPTSVTRPRAAPSMIHERTQAGGGGGSKKGTSRKSAADMIDEIVQQTAALDAETQALLAAAGAGDIYGDKADYAATKAKLLTAMQQEGIAVTPELATKIEAVAAAYGHSAQGADTARDAIRKMQRESERGADALQDVFGSVLDGADAAKRAVIDLLLEIARMQFAKGALGLLGGTSWGSTLASVIGSGIGANANGTESWTGGLTKVNERGGEILDLPSGTRIIPHDVSNRMADQAAKAGGQLSVTIGFDSSTGGLSAYVRDEAGRVVASGISAYDKALPGRVQTISQNPRKR